MGANSIDKVALLGPNWYSGSGNGKLAGYRAILGAKSAGDWDALLAMRENQIVLNRTHP